MPFVHPITGQRLPDDAAHDHKFLFVSMDTPQETEAVRARFPHIGWQDVNGTTVFQYHKAIAILCEMDDYVYDHTTDDMALESARADIITQARRSDELVAAGVADTGATDDAVDWDTAASFQQPAAPTPTT